MGKEERHQNHSSDVDIKAAQAGNGTVDNPSNWMETPNAGTLRGFDPYAEWKKIKRTAEMQEQIMADPIRTGGWPGASKVSEAFASLAERIGEIISMASANHKKSED